MFQGGSISILDARSSTRVEVEGLLDDENVVAQTVVSFQTMTGSLEKMLHDMKLLNHWVFVIR